MSVLLWCKEITLFLLIGESCNANTDCETISTCKMVCDTRGPSYHCNGSGLLEVPSFPESTLELNLSNNSLTNIPDDVFGNNVKLESLHISNNGITSVPADVFWNNVELGYLDLSNNKLTSLPGDVFKNNLRLVTLELANNNLTIVPGDVFRNNVALIYLDISGNTLTNLLLNLFSSIVDMEQLDLSNNNLISVPDAVFLNNSALQFLDFSNNNLTSVPVAFIRNNVALEHLDLSNNKLTSVSDAVFKNNVKLLTLSLANNYITSIPNDVFKNNVALLYVNLSNNNLTSVPDAVFRNNEALTHLVLSNNKITSVPGGVLENSSALTYIYCKECFDCDCLSASTYQWITIIVKGLEEYEFTCRNGVALPNTVVNCSDDGSHLAVTIIENESSCNCKESISMKSSSTDLTTETTRAMESTIDKVQHETKTNELDSAYTNIAGIISGMVASLTLITIFTALRRFSNTMSRINDSDMTDTEVNKTINDGIDFIPTIHGEMAKKYNNIPPNNHMILSSFSHIPSIPNIMDSERNSTTGKSDLCHVESSEL